MRIAPASYDEALILGGVSPGQTPKRLANQAVMTKLDAAVAVWLLSPSSFCLLSFLTRAALLTRVDPQTPVTMHTAPFISKGKART